MCLFIVSNFWCFHCLSKQKRLFFSAHRKSEWVNYYTMKESWLRSGEKKRCHIPVRKTVQACMLTSVTVHEKAPGTGIFFLNLHFYAQLPCQWHYRKHYRHFSAETQHSRPWQWGVIVQLHCWGALHLDMSLGLQLAPPSLGNWWELCFHSNSLRLWFVQLSFCGGKIVRRWRWCVNECHDYYWN